MTKMMKYKNVQWVKALKKKKESKRKKKSEETKGKTEDK